jgi:hypothetical protein
VLLALLLSASLPVESAITIKPTSNRHITFASPGKDADRILFRIYTSMTIRRDKTNLARKNGLCNKANRVGKIKSVERDTLHLSKGHLPSIFYCFFDNRQHRINRNSY